MPTRVVVRLFAVADDAPSARRGWSVACRAASGCSPGRPRQQRRQAEMIRHRRVRVTLEHASEAPIGIAAHDRARGGHAESEGDGGAGEEPASRHVEAPRLEGVHDHPEPDGAHEDEGGRGEGGRRASAPHHPRTGDSSRAARTRASSRTARCACRCIHRASGNSTGPRCQDQRGDDAGDLAESPRERRDGAGESHAVELRQPDEVLLAHRHVPGPHPEPRSAGSPGAR